MVSKLRLERIAERIREDLSEILLQEISDPRLGGVFISGVKVDRELSYADIYVSALEGSERAEEVLAGLEHAQGYLRKSLSQRIDLRTFPRLRFHWDLTPERAARIDDIIASLHRQGGADETPVEVRGEDLPDEDEDGDQ